MSMSHRRCKETHELTETVLLYRAQQLVAWKNGDKSIIPNFVKVFPNIANQPERHFAEMLTLRHYHEQQGWKGFTSYALGEQYPHSARRIEGRAKVEELVPKHRLLRLRKLRGSDHDRRFGGGEPDLFLYKGDGSFKFVEVKKGRDQLREPQIRCIAQILGVLRCEVDILYVREELQQYTPKRYRFDLEGFDGWEVS